MSAAAFQSALARMVVDPDFRDAVRAQEDGVLPGDLSPLERERLLAVAGHPGMDVTRMLHRGFRFSKLLTWLPLTCAALGNEALAREISEFWRRRLPVSFYFLEEAAAFCDYLLERVKDGLDLPCLGEVAAYERASLELQRARPAGEEPPVQEVELCHDPEALLSSAARGEPLSDVPELPCRLVGTRQDGRIEWRILEAQSLHQS